MYMSLLYGFFDRTEGSFERFYHICARCCAYSVVDYSQVFVHGFFWREYRALVSDYRTVWRDYWALLIKYRSLLRDDRVLVRDHRSLWREYWALLI